jgi:uncharacterized protein (TIGR00266 family)
MKIEILYRPSYSMGKIDLEGGEEVRVEGGSMVAMSDGMRLQTGATGGFWRSLSRSMFGGETFFQNTYQAPREGGTLYVAPALPGDLLTAELAGESMMVQSGSYVASAMDIDVTTKWSGAKTFFAAEGLIMLRAEGSGPLLLSSYGAIHPLDLAPGEKATVDTGHLVAFSEDVGFRVRSVGGIKSTLFSGEGLVVDLTGPGRVLLQSRSTDQFVSWLIPLLPFERQGQAD